MRTVATKTRRNKNCQFPFWGIFIIQDRCKHLSNRENFVPQSCAAMMIARLSLLCQVVNRLISRNSRNLTSNKDSIMSLRKSDLYRFSTLLCLVILSQATLAAPKKAGDKPTLSGCISACNGLSSPFGVLCNNDFSTAPNQAPSAESKDQCKKENERKIEACRASCRSKYPA